MTTMIVRSKVTIGHKRGGGALLKGSSVKPVDNTIELEALTRSERALIDAVVKTRHATIVEDQSPPPEAEPAPRKMKRRVAKSGGQR